MFVADTLSRAETPHLLTRPALLISGVMITSAVLLPITPWQQSVSGRGRVVAYSPVDRQQSIEAPVKGRIVSWSVVEGQFVRKGDPIVEIVDIDPDYVGRLERNLRATEERVEAAAQETAAYLAEAESLREARRVTLQAADLGITMAEQKVASMRATLEAARADLNTAKLNIDRQRKLLDDGLTSTRTFELAELKYAKAQADVNKAEVALTEAEANVMSKRAERLQKAAEADAKIASTLAKARKARAAETKAIEELTKNEVELARQSSRQVTAPRDGTILSLKGDQGGAVVKMGDELAILVPSTASRAVELWVDGNDAPLATPGTHVRLQFEGWPAVQFVGWPSVAVGTFGGTVSVVDALSRNDNGKFRILVMPDPTDEPWPEHSYLRQGVQAKGWLLLEQVPLGFELWRRLNGFPVSIPESSAPTSTGKSK